MSNKISTSAERSTFWMKRAETLIGKSFGMLLVLAVGYEEQRGIIIKCRCSCGNQKWVRVRRFYSNKKPMNSCGCQRGKHRKVFTDMRFGKLLTISRTGTKNHLTMFLCQCDCGNQKEISSSALLLGRTTSCGCNYKQQKPWLRKRPYESLYNFLVAMCRHRPHACKISYEQFVEFTKFKSCFYCGKPIIWKDHNHSKHCCTNLDRMDSSKGYEIGNIVVCCIDCNKFKGNRVNCEEFKVMMEALIRYRNQQALSLIQSDISISAFDYLSGGNPAMIPTVPPTATPIQ